VITLRDLTLSRGDKTLLSGADVTMHSGQRIGLIGANGCGKSSLFALLRGEHHADAGDIDVPPWLTYASVAQEIGALDRPALEFVLDGDARYRAAQEAIAQAERDGDGTALAEAHGRFEEVEGYDAPARAARLMGGLGFSTADLERPVADFSGGWRVRLALAQALASRADVLLLDEPTNHLDLEAVVWLEDWLRGLRSTLVVISHDREFLDGVVDTIWHIEDRTIKRYSGNYSAFEQQRAAALALRSAMYTRQQREIEHLRSFVDRFRAKATKARAAQSRLKALARMETIAAAHVDTPFSFEFLEARCPSRVLLALERVDAGYPGRTILAKVDLEIERGMRVGLLGPNGAGKSTLVKVLADRLAPLSGRRIVADGARLGYFAQHQLDELRPEDSPLRHLMRAEPDTREQELRDFLGGFDFRGNQADAPVGRFSGGEKARLALASIVRARPDVLLLDEPTNHLDLDMRAALTLALQEYEGALVVVSHDRHLLATSAERFLLVHDGGIEWFDGDLDDYRERLRRQRAEAESARVPAEGSADSRRDERRRAAESRQQLSRLRRPLENEVRTLEKKMDTLGREKRALDERLGQSETYSGPAADEVPTLLRRQAELQAALDLAETRWLELQTELESLVTD